MMSMMKRRTLLPLLLALALLTVMAALVWWQPAVVQGEGALPAPEVTLTTAHSECDVDNPRAYLVATHVKPAGADSLEYRIKWGKRAAWSRWQAVNRPAGEPWAVKTGRKFFAKPGETYRIQMRAIDEDGNVGPVARAVYYYPTSLTLAAPSNVRVAYGDDYTEARVTWSGSVGSDGWFAVQKRAIGGKWQVGAWERSKRDGEAYYHDVTGLDAEKGYEFRVTEHSSSCEASPWSDVVVLHLAPEPPSFATSTGKAGRAGDGHMMGVWITAHQDSAAYHVLTVGEGDDAKTVREDMHRFPVEVGKAYRVCAVAGNERGESAPNCRAVAAAITSPIVDLRLSIDTESTGRETSAALTATWGLIPVINAGHPKVDGTVTHSPALYEVSVREAGSDAWERRSTEYDERANPVELIGGLKGDTEYEVGVRTLYYGESDYRTATARTLPLPVRNVLVGFVADDPKSIKVSWAAPSDGAPSGYVVTVRDQGNKRVARHKPSGDALGVSIGGLVAGERYSVRVKAVAASGARSAASSCHFEQGNEGSQNRVTQDRGHRNKGVSCAATTAE